MFSVRRVEMSVVVKKRLLDLLNNEYTSYYEMVSFFQDGDISDFDKEKKAIALLNNELGKVDLNESFPNDEIDNIVKWYKNENNHVCQKYQEYLFQRKLGAERLYFKNIGQAFEFLIKVSPTKMVDGAWLYSTVHYWNDPAFQDLILIYLEELGLGHAKSNHVCIYDDLLRLLGLNDFEAFIEDKFYHQAAIQLALGYAPPEFIPEIIGFNLGYEQLPLHLLISNYELSELGINSQYFNLHVTIDNLDNGHSDKSLKTFEKFYNKYKDKEKFIEKVRRGYALNLQGVTSTQIIQNLDLENFIYKIFKRKALIGQFVHNQRQVIGCKAINEWLANPAEIEEFISQLIRNKWIELNTDPEKSRFWQLINNENGKMFGVFSPAEKQLIHDWIGGDQYSSQHLPYSQTFSKAEPLQDYLFSYVSDDELENLQRNVNLSENLALKLCKLTPFLSPNFHHKNVGLWSTQKYVELLFPYLTTSGSH